MGGGPVREIDFSTFTEEACFSLDEPESTGARSRTAVDNGTSATNGMIV